MTGKRSNEHLVRDETHEAIESTGDAGLRAVKWKGFIRTEQLPREI